MLQDSRSSCTLETLLSVLNRMAWSEFLERFIPDFYKTKGRLPTPDEVKQAEASFRAYLRSHGHIPEDEQPLKAKPRQPET